MKTFLTQKDNCAGPSIEAYSWRSARNKALKLGVDVCGELMYEAAQDGTILRIGSGFKMKEKVGEKDSIACVA